MFKALDTGVNKTEKKKKQTLCSYEVYTVVQSEKKGLNDPDNHDNVVTYLEPNILECEVRWVLGSITINKAIGGDGIPAELFQILNNDAVKVLHLTCHQIWKTQQCPQD